MAKKSRLRVTYTFLLFWLLIGALGPLAVEAEDHPGVQLLMALDTSGSMKTNDPSRLMPKAANVIVNLLGDKDYLGLYSFDEGAVDLLPLGPLNPLNRQRGLGELLRLKPQGPYTDIYTALQEALKGFDPQGPSQRALVLLTDGHMDINPQKGDSKAYVAKVQQEIIPAFKQAGIPIYTVAFTPQSDQVLLKELAEETGGRFILIT
jgi:Mg-chelatase subunit ChlD